MIAIPNMEKPKGCDGCDLVKYWVNGSFYCMADGEELNLEVDIRNDCPLIEIVRCGECKWLGIDDGMTFCNVWLREVERHMFCNYGERRADGDI